MLRAVILDVPESWVRERRERGADRWDEFWDGELHVVPMPLDRHQRLSSSLVGSLRVLIE